MKKTVRAVCSVVLCLVIALSFSSCSLFSTLKEYAEKSANQTKLDTPVDDEILNTYNTALTNAVQTADSMSISTSYSAKSPSIKKDGEKAGNLSKAAKLLSQLIMEANPGKESQTLDTPTLDGILLSTLTPEQFTQFHATRNMISEAVTDENGKEVTDEEGNVLKQDVLSDNYLKLEFLYYCDVETTPATTDENGNEVAAVTERYFADSSLIAQIFGENANEQEIIAQFDCLKNYITVNGYQTELKDCKISSLSDLETGLAYDVDYSKTVHVTAQCTCTGALEEYGDITVEFDLTKTTAFTFNYENAEG